MLHSNKENHRCLSQRAVWEIIKGLQLYAWKIARMLLMNSVTISMTHFPTPCTYQEMGSGFLNTVNFPHYLSDGMPPFLSRNSSWEKTYRESDAGIPQSFVHISVSSCPTTWQHLFMLLPNFALCYMGEKASTMDHHAQKGAVCLWKTVIVAMRFLLNLQSPVCTQWGKG